MDDHATVRVGLRAPDRAFHGPLEQRRAALDAVAGAGLDHLVVHDHVSFRVGTGFDGLLRATALAMLHPTLPVRIGVYLLALRHPMPVARQLAELSAMAPGRIVFGVGIGGEDRREVENCGVDPATRGARTDEALGVVRRLLTGEAVTHEGRHFRLDGASIRPAPDMPPPIVVGGRSNAALRRAGRLGDGWVGLWTSPRRYAEAVELIAEEAAAGGRRNVAWDHAMQVWCGFGETPEAGRKHVASAMEALYRLPFEPFERYTPCGTPEDVAAFLQPYVDAGCRRISLLAEGSSDEEVTHAAGEVARLLAA